MFEVINEHRVRNVESSKQTEFQIANDCDDLVQDDFVKNDETNAKGNLKTGRSERYLLYIFCMLLVNVKNPL